MTFDLRGTILKAWRCGMEDMNRVIGEKMEEKVQEILNSINEKFGDLEVIVDLPLLRKAESLVNEIANRSPLKKLYFQVGFFFFAKENNFVIVTLNVTIDKEEKTMEYKVGNIFRYKSICSPEHLLSFVFDVKRYSPEFNEDVIATKEIFEEVLGVKGVQRDHTEHLNELNADVFYYFV